MSGPSAARVSPRTLSGVTPLPVDNASLLPAPLPSRLLLIESDGVAAEAITDALAHLSGGQMDTLHVGGLREGLQWLGAQAFDVIVTDLSLPDARGFDSVIRLHATAPEAPIIVTTSLDDEAFALQALELGAQDYLVKGTFDETALARSLAYACQRKRLERRLLQMAHFDDVTGLCNRPIFRDRLGHLLQRARRDNQSFSLLLIGIDEFSRIHDSHGGTVADELLRQVARRLRTCVRDSDTLARIGGEQFAALLENSGDATEVVAHRIWRTLGAEIALGPLSLTIRPRIVSAQYPADGETAESLLRAAMRRAHTLSNRPRRLGLGGAYESQVTIRPR